MTKILKSIITARGLLAMASVADALACGATESEIAVALKAEATAEIVLIANHLRDQLASANPGKLQEWDIKAQIADAPSNQFTAERAIMALEAEARGLKLSELIDLVKAKAQDYRSLALTIANFEASFKAAISKVSDDFAGLEARLDQVLVTARDGAAFIVAQAT
jgi:hypothetical protein